MPVCNAYIGDPDSLSFSKGSWNGNFPSPLCKLFPWAQRTNAFHQLIVRIEDGRFEGKQTDWGCWAAKVTKGQIESFIEEVYKDGAWEHPDGSGCFTSLDKLKAFVATLDGRQTYALVAIESA